MKLLTILLVFFSCSLIAGEKGMTTIPGKNIYIEQLEEMYANIQSNTDWNTSGDMLWGYFFTHSEPEKLEKAKGVLITKGYRFVDIYVSDKDEPSDPDMFWLHMEKIETHSPKSLDETNNEFFIFAHEFGLDSYDGMDIGPVEK